jgi:hypothetical protein
MKAPLYIAQAVIYTDSGEVAKGVLIGIFKNRRNAYQAVHYEMCRRKISDYVAFVRSGFILDADSNNPKDWSIQEDVDEL